MTDSNSEIIKNKQQCVLPPVICNNLHELVEPENVFINFEGQSIENYKNGLSHSSVQPVPKYPMAITWFPEKLYLVLDKALLIKKLTIINVCSRLIYIHCCGLWNDEVRLGAFWRCYPRTRFLLAPGLSAELYVRASPNETPLIPEARVALQLAAAYKRDHVIAYFMVPIQVQFKNYIMPPCEEQSTEKFVNEEL